MSKILKNTTGLDVSISDTGVSVPASSQITIPEVDYPLWSESSDITTPVTTGDIVVNDGVADLGVTDGLNFLKYPDTAFNIRFLGETERSNLFTAKNVQEAIEQGRNSAIGALVPYVFTSTGNTSDKWLGAYVPSTSSNDVPLITMQSVDVKGVLFSNNDDNVDIDVEIYKNGSLAHTEEIRNKRTFYKVGIPSGPTFVQGDRMSVFLKKYVDGSGDSTAQDPIVWVVVKVAAEQGGTGGTQNGV